MFEHPYEKEIASIIVKNFHRKRLICECDKRFYHSIGLLFSSLLKALDISVEIIFNKGKIELITKASLLDGHVPDGSIDISSIITEDLNRQELRMVKFMQTISFLKNLEEHGYIVIYECPKPADKSLPEIYDSYEITDQNIVNFIERVRNSRILPTTALIEISIHEYKTVDRRRYEKQVKLSEEAISQAQKANKIAISSNQLSKRANSTAIAIAIFTFIISLVIAISIPTSLTKTTIYELGREIHLNTSKEPAPNINFNNYFERVDTIRYGKTTNEKR